MKKQIVVLGAGMVGRVMAIDLSKNYSVTSVDRDKNVLAALKKNFGINTVEADLRDAKKIRAAISKADLVVGAVPGFMGFEMIQTVIKAKKNIVDISFFPEDALQLDKLAKENNVTGIVDIGVAPGMDNMILGYHAQRMEVEDFTCVVGGLPFKRTLPFQYKAPFSPIDVIEEYIRPARLVEDGKIVTKPALTEPEFMQFDEIGTLEAFNTDGLRSLLKTMKIKNMREKTLRYPGHREVIQHLKNAGMFSEEKILVDGKNISPLEMTAKILLPQWKLEKNEDEFTVMRVIVEGSGKNEVGSGKEKSSSAKASADKKKKYTYDLFDRNDKQTGFSSMSRTTGFTCTAAANLVLQNLYNKKGIIPPELIGKDEKCFSFVMSYLKERGVIYRQTIS